jgi:peptidoglycan hydrolase-like protein with peptidoglycan-binding domain
VSITAPPFQPVASPFPAQQAPPGVAAPQQQAPPPGGRTWNAQLHPRGRGGKWIVSKGAGYGPGAGPNGDPTTQQLQQRLQQLGFHVPVDGKFGPQTEAAVKAFQQRYGLQTSGGVDQATLEVMQNPPDQTLAQIQAAQKATKAAASAAKKTAAGTSKKVTRKSQKGAGAATAAAGALKGTNTNVQGPGHLGTADLQAGRGMSTQTPDPAVKNLQIALSAAGIRVNQDGRFGPQTEAAVRRLQQQHGLTVDGIVGPETKGLLIGLETGKRTAKAAAKAKATTKKVSKTQPGGPLTSTTKSAPLTRRTRQPTPAHGSRSAGSRMQMKPGKKAPIATLKYHRDDLPDPDLEETTVAFGTGGQPSRSIKDHRSQGEPLADQPVWTRTGVIADPADTTIVDQRYDDHPQWSGDTTIQDYRTQVTEARRWRDHMRALARERLRRQIEEEEVTLEDRVQEAVAARKAATTGQEFVRARAREVVLRRHLEEREFSAARRETLAKKGHAMPHGGFPIVTAEDLSNAIQALGRAKNPEAAKAHIIKRAKALGLTSKLPDSWNVGS